MVVLVTGGFFAGVPAVSAAGSTVTGTVYYGALTTPVGAGDVTVSWMRAGQTPSPANSVTTDATGSFSISGLAAGMWTFYYHYNGTGNWYSRWGGSYPYGSVQTLGQLNLDGTSSYPGHAGIILEQGGSLTGRVALGAPGTWPGAGDVELWWYRYLGNNEYSSGFGTTNADGTFTIDGLGPSQSYHLAIKYVGSDPRWQTNGWYNISATGDWTPSTQWSSFPVRGPNPSVIEYPIVIQQYRTMSGHVDLGTAGVSAGAGDVVVTAFESYLNVPAPGITATTDADGNYTLTGLRSVNYTPVFTYVGSGEIARVTTGSSGVGSIVLGRGYRVSGTVSVASVGNLVGAGQVRVSLIDRFGDLLETTLTGPGGRYTFTGVVPTYHTLKFEHLTDASLPVWYWWGWGSAGIRTPGSGGSYLPLASRDDVDVVIGLGGGVVGRVTDSRNRPIAGVDVYVAGLYRSGPQAGQVAVEFQAQTDAEGRYGVHRLPGAYSYVIFFAKDGYADTQWESYSPYYAPDLIDMSDNAIEGDFSIVMFESSTITGTIGGAGVAENFNDLWVEVSVFDYGTNTWVATGDAYPVEPTGEYTIPGLFTDTYRIWARYAGEFGARSVLSSEVWAAAGQTQTVDFPSFLPDDFSYVNRDFSGEGDPDLLARTVSGDLYLFRGSGASGWSGQSLVGRGWRSFNTVLSVGDFSGDGYSDVLARNARGDLYLYRGDGAAGWLGSTKVGSGWSGFTAIVGPGDFDGDGWVDVLARNSRGDLYLFRGDGASGWLGSVKVGSGWSGFNSITAAGDFNGDGAVDVIARKSTGALYLFPGNGTGGWLKAVLIGSGWGSFTAIIGGGDFSGDGNPDVIVRNTKGELILYRGNGVGGWAGSVRIASGWSRLLVVT